MHQTVRWGWDCCKTNPLFQHIFSLTWFHMYPCFHITTRVFIDLFRDFTVLLDDLPSVYFWKSTVMWTEALHSRLPVIDFYAWFIDFDLYYLFIHLVTWFSLTVISAPDVAADVEAVKLHLLFTHPLTPVIDILDVLTPYSQIKLLGSLGNCATCEVWPFAEP